MAYTKTVWLERQGLGLDRFAKFEETPTSVVLVAAPDLITQPGTPWNVEDINKIEQGIYDAHVAIDGHLEAEPFGYEMPFDFEPTALELALWRCLPLRGQIIQISLYQRLCGKMYVGNAANDTADWWYKCNAEGTRDVNGAYMRVQDRRGLFTRADGQNSKYTMANDAPYDGAAIGSFTGDAIRNITGQIDGFFGAARTESSGALSRTGYKSVYFANSADTSNGHASNITIKIDASKVVPTALENRVASTSAYFCIKY
jgi:hypothetical protein